MDLLPFFVLSVLLAVDGSKYEFGVELYEAVLKETNVSNVIVSPWAVRECLAQMYLGAEGVAAEQIKFALQLSGSTKIEALEEFQRFHNENANDDDGPTLNTSTQLFVAQKYNILPEYQRLSKKIFNTTVTPINFSNAKTAADTINQWIAQKTNNKVNNLINVNSISNTTESMLVSAAFFKSKWEPTIAHDHLIKMPFHMSDGTSRIVEALQVERYLRNTYDEQLDARVVNIPYRDSHMSMLFILPQKKNGMQTVDENLNQIDLRSYVEKMPDSDTLVSFPKFNISLKVDLRKVLPNLGIDELFNFPDFTSLSNVSNIFISEAFHEAVIMVGQRNTESQSGSSIKEIRPLISRTNPEQQIIKVDHPFVYAIRDPGHVYFIGRVTQL